MNETNEQADVTPEPPPGAPIPTPQPRIPEQMPLIASGSTIMYPQQLMPVLATEEHDVEAIGQAAAAETKMLGVFAQQQDADGAYEGDLCQRGTAATIVRMARTPDGTVHAILQGIGRIRLKGLEQEQPWLIGKVERLRERVERSPGLQAAMKDAIEAFVRVVNLSENLPAELATAVSNIADPSALSDFIAANLHLDPEQRYAVLEEVDVNKRPEKVRE